MLSVVSFNINGGKELLDSFFETNIKDKVNENKKKRLYTNKINPDLIFLQEFSFKNNDKFYLKKEYSCKIHFLDKLDNINNLDKLDNINNLDKLDNIKRYNQFLELFTKNNNISIKNNKLYIQSYKYNNYIVFFGIYVGQYKVYNYEFKNAIDIKEYKKHEFSTHLVSLINKNINITNVHFFIINIRPLIGIEINDIIYLNLHMLSTKELDKQKDILNRLVIYLRKKVNKQFFIIGDFNMNLSNSNVKKYFNDELKVKYIEPNSFTHKTNKTKIDYLIYSNNIENNLINKELINYREIYDHIPQYFYKDLSQTNIFKDVTNTLGGYYLKYLKYKLKYNNLKYI